MLDYATPLGRTGMAGGSLLGALGHGLGPLDYPRQALWNLPGKLSEGDLVGALPGLLGVGAGAGLAASGAGLPLAVLGGSALGGLAQGVGKSLDEDRFDAPDPSALARALGLNPDSPEGKAVAMALGVAGDPLLYAGGLGGRAAGQAGGHYLEDVALARGPRYPGGAEKLLEGGRGLDDERRVQALLGSPHAAQVLSEVPPGSQFLGSGAEALAFHTPEGGVVRIAGGPGAYDVARSGHSLPTPPSPPVQIPEVLRPVRDVPVGPYRVQHQPFLDMLQGEGSPQMVREMEAAVPPLTAAVEDRGYLPRDLHIGNVGRTGAGRYVVSDPGAVLPPHGAPPVPEPIQARPGGTISHALLDLLGSDEALRRGIAQEVAQRGGSQGLDIPEVVALMQRRRALAQVPSQLVNAPTGPLPSGSSGPILPSSQIPR